MRPSHEPPSGDESTLIVTAVEHRSGESETDDEAPFPSLERVEGGPVVLSFANAERLLRAFTPTTLALVGAIHRERPTSVDETARVVDRDVEKVHDELKRLDRLGVIEFVEEERARRPVVRFDEVVVRLSSTGVDQRSDEPPAPGGRSESENGTGRRRSGVDLEEAHGRVTDAFLALDTEARVTYLNERAEELLAPSADRPVGTVIWERFPAAVGTAFETEFRRAMESQEPVAFEEYCPSIGAWLAVRAYPSETGLSSYVRDVTERKERERRLDRRRERLVAINQLNAVIQDVTHAVIETSSRAEIERQVCEKLVGIDDYAFVWIGHVDRGGREVRPTAMAGGDEEYLEEITISIDGDDPTAHGPTGTAIRSHEPQFVQDTLADPGYEPWREDARKRDFRSSAAIPILYEDVLYGVVNVYSPHENAFAKLERDTLVHLGEVIGHAAHAIEQRKALTSDAVLELEFRNEEIARTLREGIADERSPSEMEISVERTVRTDQGSILQFVTARGMTAEQYGEVLDRLPSIERVSLLAEGDDELLFEVQMSGPSLSGALASYGGRVKRLTVTSDELRLIAELPPDADVRAVTGAINDVYSGTELLAQRTSARGAPTRQELHETLADRLTEKQRTALETAYAAGYFDWPRTSTGEEVAEMLGVSAPTFAQHLRTAQRKLFAGLYDDS
jgi:HTH-type transcriptional regulator, bacterioopsin transcriptional activator and related proteins